MSEENKKLIIDPSTEMKVGSANPAGLYLHINKSTGAIEWAKAGSGDTDTTWYLATETYDKPSAEETGWVIERSESGWSATKPYLWGCVHFAAGTTSEPYFIGYWSSNVHEIRSWYKVTADYNAPTPDKWQDVKDLNPETQGTPAEWVPLSDATKQLNSVYRYMWVETFLGYFDNTWSEATVQPFIIQGSDGSTGYTVQIANDYASIPCAYDWTVNLTEAQWKTLTTHTVTAFLNTSKVSFGFYAQLPTYVKGTTPEIVIVYTPVGLSVKQDTSANTDTVTAGLGVDSVTLYATGFTEDYKEGRVEYTLYKYEDGTGYAKKAVATFSAAKLKEADPTTVHFIKSNCVTIREAANGAKVPENIIFYAMAQKLDEVPAAFSGYWKYYIDDATTPTEQTSGSTLTIESENITSTIKVELYKDASATSYYDYESINVVKDGSVPDVVHIQNDYVSIPCTPDGTVVSGYTAWQTDTLHTVSATHNASSVTFDLCTSSEEFSASTATYRMLATVANVSAKWPETKKGLTNYDIYITSLTAGATISEGSITYDLYYGTGSNPVLVDSGKFIAAKNFKGETTGRVWIFANAEKVNMHKDGTRYPNVDYVTFDFYQQFGSESIKRFYDGWYTYQVDNKSISDAIRVTDESAPLPIPNKNDDPEAFLKNINVTLYGNKTNEQGEDEPDYSAKYDTETVTLIADGEDGADGYSIVVGNPFDLVPCDSDGNPNYTDAQWKSETKHSLTCYWGGTALTIDGGLINSAPGPETTNTYTLVYALDDVDKDHYFKNLEEATTTTFKPYITGITGENADAAKVKYTLYVKDAAKAEAAFVASKNKQGNPGDDYHILTTSQTILVDSDGTKFPSKETGITFYFKKTPGETGIPEAFESDYKVVIDGEEKIIGRKASQFTLSGDDYDSATTKVHVVMYYPTDDTELLDINMIETEDVDVVYGATSPYNISISNPFDLVPCSGDGTPSYADGDWKSETLHGLTCFCGRDPISVSKDNFKLSSDFDPTTAAENTYTLVYTLKNIDSTKYKPNIDEAEPTSGDLKTTFKPYITGINSEALSGKVSYALYLGSTIVAETLFTASKNLSGDDYRILTTSDYITVDTDGTKTPTKEEGIKFTFQKKAGNTTTGYQSYTGKYRVDIDGETKVEPTTGNTYTISGNAYDAITKNIKVYLWDVNEASPSEENIYDWEDVIVIKSGGQGEQGLAGDTSISQTIYAFNTKYEAPTLPTTPVTSEEAPTEVGVWSLTKPDCKVDHDGTSSMYVKLSNEYMLLGDVNGDDTINTDDTTLLSTYYKSDLTDDQLVRGNVNLVDEFDRSTGGNLDLAITRITDKINGTAVLPYVYVTYVKLDSQLAGDLSTLKLSYEDQAFSYKYAKLFKTCNSDYLLCIYSNTKVSYTPGKTLTISISSVGTTNQPFVYQAVQSYQLKYSSTEKKYIYKDGTLIFTTPELIEAYKNKYVSTTEYAEFIKLTNNGQQQGLYYGGSNDADLYVNATYIKTGTLDANLITTGKIVGQSDTGLFIDVEAGTIGYETGGTKTYTIKSQTYYYLRNTDPTTKPEPEDPNWSTTYPSWVDGEYIWQKIHAIYSDGTVDDNNITCLTGAIGASGTAIVLLTEAEYTQDTIKNISTQSTVWTTPKITNTSDLAKVKKDDIVHVRVKNTTATGTGENVYAYIILKVSTIDTTAATAQGITQGYYGAACDGKAGDTGIGVSKITNYYRYTETGTPPGKPEDGYNDPPSPWSTSSPTYKKGYVIWKTEQTKYTNNYRTYTEVVSSMDGLGIEFDSIVTFKNSASDGSATVINGGSIISESLSASTIKGGTLTLGGIDGDNGKLQILGTDGETILGEWTNAGITINAGSINIKDKFKVDSAGNLTATAGTFSGKLSAATGTFSGSLSAATGTFSGELQAASGTFTGTLKGNTITAANISGSTIDGSTINVGSSSSSSGGLYIYDGSSSTAIGKWTSSGIEINKGSINLGNGVFTVDSNGNLTAQAGTIGGCTIENNKLSVPFANITGTLSADKIKGGTIDAANVTISGTLSSANIVASSITCGSGTKIGTSTSSLNYLYATDIASHYIGSTSIGIGAPSISESGSNIVLNGTTVSITGGESATWESIITAAKWDHTAYFG